MEQTSSQAALPLVQPTDRLVYFVTNDQHLESFITQQIGHFGYFVQVVKDFKSLRNAMAEHKSVAILVDIPPQKENAPSFALLEEMAKDQKITTPLMFIADQDQQPIRLQAIRAGGVAFFTKPIDTVALIDKLDELRDDHNTDPYRILVIEDQSTIANYYQMVLKMSGIDAQVVTDATRVLQQINEYHPDLILMDLYMPDANGLELTKLIRQIEEFVSIPIVFLSGEDDFTKQMEAMSMGGDDFLTKPIKASNLVAMVRSRLERLKILRSYMVRDSLTGLLNHTSFRSILAQEVNRCKRQSNTLAVAMLDLDHFKLVNDTYGHAVGDTVLKGLSRLLKQRLRKSDIIGRYGGEEFVVLLLDADAENAARVMDEIRQHFAQVEYHPDKSGVFSVTFSCGVATYPKFMDPRLLTEAADQALYAAKAAGRNQVKIANF